MVVYDYDSTVEGGWVAGTSNSSYYNLRFYNKSLNWSNSTPMRIFRIPSGALTNRSIYSAIGNI
jgi:hypothetical protein